MAGAIPGAAFTGESGNFERKDVMFIAKFEDEWTPEERYNVLIMLDEIVRKCAGIYVTSEIWDEYGGGRKGTESETDSFRWEIANDSEKFIDALYAFAVCLLYDREWTFRLTPEE